MKTLLAALATVAALTSPAWAFPPSCPGTGCVTTCLPDCVTNLVEPLCPQTHDIKVDC